MDDLRLQVREFFLEMKKVIKGQDRKLAWLLSAFLTGRHVLLEDKPGTGKTTLSKVLALCTGSDFSRVQFTPDLMPSDILGVSIYHKDRLEFDFQAGPIFTQILLADEINRSSPRTQSALLEAMAERQVSVEGETHALDELFFVIATQNPQSFQGTYPLPEAQLDRFSLCFDLGYLPIEDEVDLAMGVSCQGLMLSSDSPMSPKAVLDKDMVLRCRKMIENVDIHRDLVRYLVGMVQDTRGHSSFRLGVSPRSSMDLVVLSKALAWVDGQDFVSPEHIRELFIPVLEHRLLVSPTFSQGGEQVSDILLTLIDETPLPR